MSTLQTYTPEPTYSPASGVAPPATWQQSPPLSNAHGRTLQQALRADRCQRVIQAVRREQRYLGATWIATMGMLALVCLPLLALPFRRDEETLGIAVFLLLLLCVPIGLGFIIAFASAHGRAYAEARELQDRLSDASG